MAGNKNVVGPPAPPPTEQTAIVGNRSKASGNSPVDPRAGFDVERQIRGEFESILSGKKGSFTDERLALEKQKISEEAASRKSRLTKELDRNLVRRGVFGAGIGARSQREIDLSVDKSKSNAFRELRIKKLASEWSDRITGLNMAQKWLDSRRSYEIGKEQIAATREATRARTALGYAQIAASKENAARSAGVAAASLGLRRDMFNESVRQYEESKIPIGGEDLSAVRDAFGGATSLPQSVVNTIMNWGPT